MGSCNCCFSRRLAEGMHQDTRESIETTKKVLLRTVEAQANEVRAGVLDDNKRQTAVIIPHITTKTAEIIADGRNCKLEVTTKVEKSTETLREDIDKLQRSVDHLTFLLEKQNHQHHKSQRAALAAEQKASAAAEATGRMSAAFTALKEELKAEISASSLAMSRAAGAATSEVVDLVREKDYQAAQVMEQRIEEHRVAIGAEFTRATEEQAEAVERLLTAHSEKTIEAVLSLITADKGTLPKVVRAEHVELSKKLALMFKLEFEKQDEARELNRKLQKHDLDRDESAMMIRSQRVFKDTLDMLRRQLAMDAGRVIRQHRVNPQSATLELFGTTTPWVPSSTRTSTAGRAVGGGAGAADLDDDGDPGDPSKSVEARMQRHTSATMPLLKRSGDGGGGSGLIKVDSPAGSPGGAAASP